MRVTTLAVLMIGLLIASTGCVSKGRYDSEVGTLQQQLAQKDAALKAQQAALQPKVPAIPVEPYAGAMYRTATGFEIPAKDIQKALKGAGYYSGVADGKIGPDSREAIRNFQRDNGLKADGVCGSKTWAKLKEHLA